MKKYSTQKKIFQKKKGDVMKVKVALLLLGIFLVGGCGTAANEVSKITTPERTTVTVSQTSIPSENMITAVENASPAADQLLGTAGSVEGGATVRVYDVYPNGTLLYSGTAAANGSFSIDVGDDDPNTSAMFVTAESSGKTESLYVVITK